MVAAHGQSRQASGGAVSVMGQHDERELAVDGTGAALLYDPDHLLDALCTHLGLANDAALSRKLRVKPPTLSKVRNRRVAVSSALLIAMHEASGLTISELRALMGDRREYFTPLIFEESVTIVR
jgi:hypothetical protein